MKSPQMERRRIGRSELRIAPLVLGGNVFGWTADQHTSFRILDAFLDAGLNAVDTSDNYSSWIAGHVGGESETVIGAWLKARGCRDRIVLATKVGARPRAHDRGGVGRGWGGDLSPGHIVQAVEHSLRRLQTDYIDLYQSHMNDPDTPVEHTLEAYGRLIGSGKVRVIGASNYDATALADALHVSDRQMLPRYQSLQPLYNLCDRDAFEGALRDVSLENDVGVICYASLARGFLTGKYRTGEDYRASPWEARLKAYASKRGLRILAALEEVADELRALPAQVALAWVMAQPGITAPIAAVNSVPELDEILGAVGLVLDERHLDALSAASAPEHGLCEAVAASGLA